MSIEPLRCKLCDVECRFERIGMLPGMVDLYGISWICPSCKSRNVDLCPVAPIVAPPGNCLNCGSSLPPEGESDLCDKCDPARQGALAFFQLAAWPADPLVFALEAFDKGLARKGFAVLGQALRKDPLLVEAWSLRRQFIAKLGFQERVDKLDEQAGQFGVPTRKQEASKERRWWQFPWWRS